MFDFLSYIVTYIENSNYLISALIYTVVYSVCIILLIPICGPLSIFGGSIFGLYAFWLSLLSSVLGAFVILYFFHNRVEKYLKDENRALFHRVRNFFSISEFLWLVLLRLLPILPFSVVSVLSAQIVYSKQKYLFATALGCSPGLFLHTIIGIELKWLAVSDSYDLLNGNLLLPLLFLCVLSIAALIINYIFQYWFKDYES